MTVALNLPGRVNNDMDSRLQTPRPLLRSSAGCSLSTGRAWALQSCGDVLLTTGSTCTA